MIRDVGLMEEPRWLIVRDLFWHGVRVLPKQRSDILHAKKLEHDFDQVRASNDQFSCERHNWSRRYDKCYAKGIAFQCVLIFTQPGSRCREILANLYNIVIEQEWPEG